MKRQFITERRKYRKHLPDLCFGGVLQMKHRKICLRLADELTVFADGNYKLVRRWLKPERGKPFDRDIYAFQKSG